MAGLILLLRAWGKVKLLLRTVPQEIYVHIKGRNFQTAERTRLRAGRSLLIPARGPTLLPMDCWSSFPEGGPAETKMLRAWTLLHCAVSRTWVTLGSVYPRLACTWYIVWSHTSGNMVWWCRRLVGPAPAGQQFPVPKKRTDSPPDCLWVWVS